MLRLRRVSPFAAPAAIGLLLAGCSVFEPRPVRPAWREQAENACVAQKKVRASEFIRPASEIDGPGICGMTKPFKVTALQNGEVAFNATSTLDCQMIAALDEWLAQTVQPIAEARFGQRVAQINSMGAYSCRGLNGSSRGRLSEHAFGNALDIGGFVLADGRSISIMRDWTRGDEQTQAFLRDVHAGACETFTTVLSPGSNQFHYNHIHIDLAMHGMTRGGPRRVCKPVPGTSKPLPSDDGLPSAPEIDDDIDVAQTRGRDMQALHRGPQLAAPLPPVRANALAASRSGSLRADGAFEPDDDDPPVSKTRRR
jgi:hypothetical protein